MNKLMCLLGFHNWVCTAPEYDNEMSERLGITKVPATRTCSCCNKLQHQEIHCLGLNPPEYITTWRTVNQ